MSLGWTQPVTEMSARNISWGSKGDRCVELTTLPPSGAECLEIWEPQPNGILLLFTMSFPQLRNWPIARSVPRSHAALHKTQISELVDTYPHTATCWCILKVRIRSKVEICKGASLSQSAQAGVKLHPISIKWLFLLETGDMSQLSRIPSERSYVQQQTKLSQWVHI